MFPEKVSSLPEQSIMFACYWFSFLHRLVYVELALKDWILELFWMILFSLFDQEYLQRTDGCRLSPFTGLHFDFLNNNLQSILYSYRTVVINFTCKIMDNISSIISSINRISIIFRCNYQSASSEYVFFILTYRIFFYRDWCFHQSDLRESEHAVSSVVPSIMERRWESFTEIEISTYYLLGLCHHIW